VLFALALKVLGDSADAEDVLQDTFIQVWQTAGSFDLERSKSFGRLVMLTRSRAIDRLRCRKTRARVTEAASVEPQGTAALLAQQAGASETQLIASGAMQRAG